MSGLLNMKGAHVRCTGKKGLPVEALATEDSTELATPPEAGRVASVPLKTTYEAVTFLLFGLYTGLHGKAAVRCTAPRSHW